MRRRPALARITAMQVQPAAPLTPTAASTALSQGMGRRLLVIAGAIAGVFGLVMGLGPGLLPFFPQLPAPMAADPTAMPIWTGVAFLRLAGILLAGLGAVAVAVGRLEDARSRRVLASVLAGVGALGAGITAIQQLAIWSARTWLGWLVAVTLLALCAAATSLTLAERRAIRRREDELARRQAKIDAQLREAAAQEERNRLARDLHDTIKQQLFSINVAAATAQSLRERDPEAAAQHIQQVRDLSQAAMVEMKALLAQLRPQPLATVGLIGAIQEQLDALHFRADVHTEFHADPWPEHAHLSPMAQEAVFRVVQEALANVARHARAEHVAVRMTFPPSRLSRSNGTEAYLRITIADDGQGFAPAGGKTGMGMSNMRARIAELGGKFDVQSAPGQGTTVAFDVPLVSEQQRREQAQQEKEERFQQVYWASSLSIIATALCAMLAIVVASLGSGIAAVDSGQRTVRIVIFAIGVALALPFVFASANLRRRVRAYSPPGSVWRDLMRSQDVQHLGFLVLLGGWVSLSLRWFVPAALLIALAVIVVIVVARAHRRLEQRLEEWATQHLLRSRRNEQLIFFGFGAVFALAMCAGLFGDLSQVRVFHDRLDQAWLTSFLAIPYPTTVLCGALSASWFHRMLSRLRAIEGDAPAPPTTDHASAERVRRLRPAAITLAALYFALTFLAGAFLSIQSVTGGVAAALGAAVVLILKWRVERTLTSCAAAWSSLEAQRSALMVYLLFFIVAMTGVVGALVGGAIAIASPASAVEAARPPIASAPLWFLFGLTTGYVGAPFYLLMQVWMTQQRIKLLRTSLRS